MKGGSKPNKTKHRKNKISFDEEVVSKGQARKLLSGQELNPSKPNEQILEKNVSEFKTKEKNKKRKQPQKDSKNKDQVNPKKKRNLDNETPEATTDIKGALNEIKTVQEQEIQNQPKKESIRAQKRKKHAKFLEQKKLNNDFDLRQKTLNYLSKWKHSRSEWKFEKLKQVWIQQNLFDTSKIPGEFWETAVEYFSGAKGHSRQVVLDEALKLIENGTEGPEENLDEDYQMKLKRARDIAQSLQ